MLNSHVNLKSIVEAIEVPDSYYDLARERYGTIGKHLVREDSSVRDFAPFIHSQGSFRIGTAIRPLGDQEEFDVDLVCCLNDLTKEDVSQAELRTMLIVELESYAARNSMKNEPRDRARCVTLHYAGKPSFHVDVLPCIPEDQATLQALTSLGSVPPDWAVLAVAITDRNDPAYRDRTIRWPSSNPDAYGRWFVERMTPTLEFREAKNLAELPVYKRKTPLQRVVQLLKRHCCNFFAVDPTYRPISTLITTLAANLYQGERSVEEAFINIVPRLSTAMSRQNPQLLNPVNHLENFADKWTRDEGYYHAFSDWCFQLNEDLETLMRGDQPGRRRVADRGFKAVPQGGREGAGRVPRVEFIRTPVTSPQGEKPWQMEG